MTREEFMELMGLTEENMEELELDADHEAGESWFDIAKGMINQLNYFVARYM